MIKMSMLFVLEVVLVVIIGCVGIIGNCLLIKLFMKTGAKLNFHRLMIALAVYDNIYVALCILLFAVPEVFEGYKIQGYHFYVVPFVLPIIQIALTGSVYCTVGISLERYLTVCHPFYVSRKRWSSRRYIIPIAIFSFVYNITRFFELRTKYVPFEPGLCHNITFPNLQNTTEEAGSTSDMNGTLSNLNSSIPEHGCVTYTDETEIPSQIYEYTNVLTPLRANPLYYSVYIIGLNFIFNGLLPFTFIISLNVLLYKQLKISRKQNPSFRAHSLPMAAMQLQFQIQQPGIELKGTRAIKIRKKRIKPSEIILARVSIMIVFVFIVCHSIRWIPNVYELIQRINSQDGNVEWPPWVESMTGISHFLTVLNSSVNFYIYCATHYGLPTNMCLKPRSTELELSRTSRAPISRRVTETSSYFEDSAKLYYESAAI